MDLQGRNLTQGLNGADVGELTQLGLAVPASETQAAQFGAGTLAAVNEFQSGQGLAPAGTVDPATAAALSSLILLRTDTVTVTVKSPARASVGALPVRIEVRFHRDQPAQQPFSAPCAVLNYHKRSAG